MLEVLLVPSVLVNGSGPGSNFTGYAATLPLSLVDVRTWSGLVDGSITVLPEVIFSAANGDEASGLFKMFWNIHDSNPAAATNPAWGLY